MLGFIVYVLAVGFVVFFAFHGIWAYLFRCRLGQCGSLLPSFKVFYRRLIKSKVSEIVLDGLERRDSPVDIFSNALSTIARLLGADAWSFLLTPKEGGWKFLAWSDHYDRLELDQIAKRVEEFRPSNVMEVVKTKKPMALSQPLKFNKRIRSWLGVPMILDDEVVGVFNLDWFRRKTMFSLKRKARMAEYIIEDLAKLTSAFFRLRDTLFNAQVDPVTEVYNRTVFERIRGELGSSYTVVFMDLDGFKQVNDTAGHRVGDRVLTIVAERIRRVIRSSDLLVRYGGDEFVVITEARGNGLESLVDRIKRAVEEPMNVEEYEFHLDVSIGVAFVPEEADSLESAIELADKRMYEEKRRGHGRRRQRDV